MDAKSYAKLTQFCMCITVLGSEAASKYMQLYYMVHFGERHVHFLHRFMCEHNMGRIGDKPVRLNKSKSPYVVINESFTLTTKAGN